MKLANHNINVLLVYVDEIILTRNHIN